MGDAAIALISLKKCFFQLRLWPPKVYNLRYFAVQVHVYKKIKSVKFVDYSRKWSFVVLWQNEYLGLVEQCMNFAYELMDLWLRQALQGKLRCSQRLCLCDGRVAPELRSQRWTAGTMRNDVYDILTPLKTRFGLAVKSDRLLPYSWKSCVRVRVMWLGIMVFAVKLGSGLGWLAEISARLSEKDWWRCWWTCVVERKRLKQFWVNVEMTMIRVPLSQDSKWPSNTITFRIRCPVSYTLSSTSYAFQSSVLCGSVRRIETDGVDLVLASFYNRREQQINREDREWTVLTAIVT